MCVWSLDWEDPLEQGTEFPGQRNLAGLQSIGSQRVSHYWNNLTHIHVYTPTHTHTYVCMYVYVYMCVCIYMPHFLYPCSYWWTFRLFSSLGYHKQCCYEHKGLSIKAMVFPVVMYGCESWTIKKAECRRIDAFELWCSQFTVFTGEDSWESRGLQGDPTSPS